MVIKSYRPSINFTALPLLRSILAEDFSAKLTSRFKMVLEYFCVKVHL